MGVCACVCVWSPSKAGCSALLCWPGHVATLKLLSERPVKLLRSSTTLAVGSGNPSASCSRHTHTHTLLFVSHVHAHSRPSSPSLFLSVIVCFLCSVSPALSAPRCDCGSRIIYVVKHHCGPSVSAGTGPAAHVSSCIPARIAANALWQAPPRHVLQRRRLEAGNQDISQIHLKIFVYSSKVSAFQTQRYTGFSRPLPNDSSFSPYTCDLFLFLL